MALSKSTASRVVAAVFSDATCRKAIPTRSSGRRVFTYLAGERREQSPEYRLSPNGLGSSSVARCTALAIAGAQHKGKISQVLFVSEVPGRTHEATLLEMADGSKCVFDWYATLDILNPLLYPSHEDWAAERASIFYQHFNGWS